MVTAEWDAALVGICEYPRRDVNGELSALQIKAEYFNIKPNVIDTAAVGGSSYEFHAAPAMRAIASGQAKVARLTYGSLAHSRQYGESVGDDAHLELLHGRQSPHVRVRHDERCPSGLPAVIACWFRARVTPGEV